MADLLTYARTNPSRQGIITASRYLVDVASCLVDGHCPMTGVDPKQKGWKEALQDAETKLTASFDEWGFRNIKQSDKDNYILTATGIMSTAKVDTDKDILEPAGCTLAPKMPFLWHHMVMQPVGKVITGKVTDKDVKIKVGIMDIGNGLGRDTAALIEMDAIRISHGFDALEAKPIKGGGWHVTQYETFEASGVTLPANSDAVFVAFEKGRFKHDVVKDYIKGHYDSRSKVWKGMNLPKTEVKEKEEVKEPKFKYWPLPGSWEDVEGKLNNQVRSFLEAAGVSMEDGWASIQGTYAEFVIVATYIDGEESHYRIAWEDIQNPKLIGDPSPVEVVTTVSFSGGEMDDDDVEEEVKTQDVEDNPVEAYDRVLTSLGL